MMLDKAIMGTLQGQGKVPLTHLNAQDALMVTYLTRAVVKKKKTLGFRSQTCTALNFPLQVMKTNMMTFYIVHCGKRQCQAVEIFTSWECIHKVI